MSEIPATDLYAELRRRKARVHALLKKYEQLLEQASKLRKEIEAHGGAVTGEPPIAIAAKARVRPFNRTSLANLMQQVLAGKSLSVDEVVRGVLDAGYRSSSSNLRTIVNLTLIKDPRFKRVARGVYTAKPRKAA